MQGYWNTDHGQRYQHLFEAAESWLKCRSWLTITWHQHLLEANRNLTKEPITADDHQCLLKAIIISRTLVVCNGHRSSVLGGNKYHLSAHCTMLLQYIYPCKAILPGSPFRVFRRPCSCFCIFSIGVLCRFHPTSIMYLKQLINEVISTTQLCWICVIPVRVVPQPHSNESRAQC